MRIALGQDTPDSRRDKYALETLLSTVGVPFDFASSGDQHCIELHPEEMPAFRDVEQTPGTALTPTLSQREKGESGAPSFVIPQASVLTKVFRALARSEEYEVAERDKYGRFLWAHTATRPQEDAARPIVSEYAQALLASLKSRAQQAGLPFISKEPWPDGRPMAACLTHDVDSIRRGKLPGGIAARDLRAAASSAVTGHLARSARQVGAALAQATGPNPYWTFDRISAMEKKHGYRSTYFVMAGRLHPEDAAYDPRRQPMLGLLRSLADSGCEIALHGSFGPYGDPEAIRRQKALLEGAVGMPVSGHRNHVLRFTAPQSWRAQEAAGLSYDATLGFADHEGYRGCHAFPFRPFDAGAGRALDLLEIPLAVMDVTLHKYRGLRGEAAWAATERVLDDTLAARGLATLLWHNDTFYDAEYPGCGALYVAALDWLSNHEAWVTTCGEVDRWWRAREAAQLAPLPGGTGWELSIGEGLCGLVVRVWLPDGSTLRTDCAGATLTRAGDDNILTFGPLEAGSTLRIFASNPRS